MSFANTDFSINLTRLPSRWRQWCSMAQLRYIPLSQTGQNLSLLVSQGYESAVQNYFLAQSDIQIQMSTCPTARFQTHWQHLHCSPPLSHLNQPGGVSQYWQTLLCNVDTYQASDIHLEPFQQGYRIRLRQDGHLRLFDYLTTDLAHQLINKLKVMAGLDMAENRRVQEGRLWVDEAPTPFDARLSFCPLVLGEKMVIRRLPSNARLQDLLTLGFQADQQALFLSALSQPQGLILVTGPTGSGKTVTLYSALHHLNRDERNIATAEDPVEMIIPGINQVTVTPALGLTYPAILKTCLRQDPDSLMIGEIRDLETALTTLQAAQTGHLVLSTLHTNGTMETVQRLLSMGVPAFQLMGALKLIVAQRLLRRLCPHCRGPQSHDALREAGFSGHIPTQATLYTPQGCQHCYHGYQGRLAIFECLPLTPEMITQVQSQHTDLPEGVMSLWACACSAMYRGETSIEEIYRVLSVS